MPQDPKKAPPAGTGQQCEHDYGDDMGSSCIYCGAINPQHYDPQPWNKPMRPEVFQEPKQQELPEMDIDAPMPPVKPPKPEPREEAPMPIVEPSKPTAAQSEASLGAIQERTRNYELEIMQHIFQRTLIGRKAYGKFDPTKDKRDLARELLAEIVDSMFYAGALTLQLEEVLDEIREGQCQMKKG